MHASYFQFNSMAMGLNSVQWTGTFEVVYCVQLKMKGINNLFDMTPFTYRLEKIRVSKVPPRVFSKICNILWQILSFLVTWNSLREKDQTVQAKKQIWWQIWWHYRMVPFITSILFASPTDIYFFPRDVVSCYQRGHKNSYPMSNIFIHGSKIWLSQVQFFEEPLSRDIWGWLLINTLAF